MPDYTELTLTELAEGINQTDSAIGRCREILHSLGQPKIEGLQQWSRRYATCCRSSNRI